MLGQCDHADEADDSRQASNPRFSADWFASRSSALNLYVELVAKRNSAVVSYNAALQLLWESLSDANYYAKQHQQLGIALLQLDPNLPAIHFWLACLRDTLRQDIMQRLNYEGRAVCSWGLRAPFAFHPSRSAVGYSDRSARCVAGMQFLNWSTMLFDARGCRCDLCTAG